MSKVILRISGQDDMSYSLPDSLIDGRRIYIPNPKPITVGSDPFESTVDKLEFDFIGYEERGHYKVPIYKLMGAETL